MHTLKVVTVIFSVCWCVSALTLEDVVQKYMTDLGVTAEKTGEVLEKYMRGITRDYEELVATIIDCLREEIQDGNEVLGIPSLNPLQLSDLALDFGELDGIEGNIDIARLAVSGITSFSTSVSSASFSAEPFSVNATFSFDEIAVLANFNGDVTLFDMINIFADSGYLSLSVKDINLSVYLYLAISGGLDLKLEVDWQFDSIDLELLGLQNDTYMSTLVGNRLKAIIEDLLTNYKDQIKSVIGSLASNIDIELSGEVFTELISLASKCFAL